ncbi:MAG TPA: hypothetical protein VFQ88_14530 [Nevskiaceae bacterium]|nr:hypothetical protein [Nevskiaceae bacterium]
MRNSSKVWILMLGFGVATAVTCAAASTPPPQATAAPLPSYIVRAIHDPARAADRKDDARRKMAAVMRFSEVKPGDKVFEIEPGSGYWTRVFSQIVGPQGHVYQMWPTQWNHYYSKGLKLWLGLVKTPHYANVSVLQQPAADPAAPEKIDVAFTSENYHDFLDPFSGPVNMRHFDRRIYAMLKPGGLFIVIDNLAPPGAEAKDTNTLHRIGPNVVKRQVEAAGFVLDGSSDALLNPKDPLTIKVFDPSIEGHVSQFMLRFRKPR